MSSSAGPSSAFLLAAPLAVEAEQPAPPSVGLLFLGTHGTDIIENDTPLKEGLQELGWIENQNIRFEYRFASGNRERLNQLAAELVRQKA